MSNPPVISINDELVAELEQLAGKATPGPWWIDSHGHNMVSESMDHKLIFTADDRMGKAQRNKETGNLSHWPNDWDASFIATANPATILALLSERAKLIESVRELSKDAERYRYMRDYLRHDNKRWESAGNWNHSNIPAPEFDAAVDAARSATNEDKQ